MNFEYNKEKTLEFIKEYKLLGFCVIPLKFKDKIPKIEWKEYQTRKPTNDEIDFWFSSPSNVGIVCGEISDNLIVLDFESEKAYEEFFPNKKIQDNTFSVKTNRGIHIYFKTDKPIKTSTIPGIVDVISEKHTITAPPSIHPKGTRYVKINEERNIAKITKKEFEELFWSRAEELGYYKKKGMYTNFGPIKTLPKEIPHCISYLMKGVKEGSRNNVGFLLATYFKNQKLCIEEIAERLVQWNKKNQPPMDYEEISSTINSALKNKYGLGCENTLLKENCNSKKGECVFQDMEFLISENTESVQVFKPKVDGDPIRYKITILGRSFELESDKMLTPTIFKRRWLEKHGRLINISNKKWSNIVNSWMNMCEEGEEDEISTEQEIIDRIVDEINSCDITLDKELCISERRLLYVEMIPKNNPKQKVELYYPNKNIREILNSINAKTDLRRIRNLLSNYLLSHTKKIRVGRGTKRFWVFNSKKFDIDWSKQVSLDDDIKIIKEFDEKKEVKNK